MAEWYILVQFQSKNKQRVKGEGSQNYSKY